MLIINSDRNPKYSLYHIGAEALSLLSNITCYQINDLYNDLNHQYNGTLSVDYFYITLDWLFLIDIIRIEENKVFIK